MLRRNYVSLGGGSRLSTAISAFGVGKCHSKRCAFCGILASYLG